MAPPTLVVPLVLTVLLGAFYLWMFRDMVNNGDLLRSPWTYFGVALANETQSTRHWHWTVAFVFLNVFAAALYLTEYRRREAP